MKAKYFILQSGVTDPIFTRQIKKKKIASRVKVDLSNNQEQVDFYGTGNNRQCVLVSH